MFSLSSGFYLTSENRSRSCDSVSMAFAPGNTEHKERRPALLRGIFNVAIPQNEIWSESELSIGLYANILVRIDLPPVFGPLIS
jgi:hypothetical protein